MSHIEELCFGFATGFITNKTCLATWLGSVISPASSSYPTI
jgi:hypothetical protein